MEQYGARRRPPHAVPEDRADRRRRRPRSRRFADGLDEIGLTARPSQLAPQHDGLHRHRVLQARDRRHQGARPRPGRPSWSGASPTSTRPITVNVNGCPNACARTQVADIGLKGQLVMRRRRQAGRGLPGAPRRRHRAAGQLRPQAARPQGDQRRARRLRHRASCTTTSPTATDGESFATWVARADEELLRGEKALEAV